MHRASKSLGSASEARQGELAGHRHLAAMVEGGVGGVVHHELEAFEALDELPADVVGDGPHVPGVIVGEAHGDRPPQPARALQHVEDVLHEIADRKLLRQLRALGARRRSR